MTIKFYAKTTQGWLIKSPLEAFTFPGGEAHIKGVEDLVKYEYQIADVRGADSHDLIMLAMWSDVCRTMGTKTVLILPYLPGARGDRGVPFGADVYSRFLRGLTFDQIITVDPHSPVMPTLLGKLTVYPFERLLRQAVGSATSDEHQHPYVGVIAPDKGAVDRATRAAETLHVPVYRAEKVRDFETGKLSGFTCEKLPEVGRLLIVDDICDGGGTFVGLADHIAADQGVGLSRLDLWVTHGIFSKGTRELAKRFNRIIATDSHPGITPHTEAYIKTVPVFPALVGEIRV